MSQPPLSSARALPGMATPNIKDQKAVVPVMYSARTYLLITLAISLSFGVLALPSGLIPRKHVTVTDAVIICANTVLAFQIQFLLQYLLRYHPNPVQHWFSRQSRRVDRLLRAILTGLMVTSYFVIRRYIDPILGIALDDNSLLLIVSLAQLITAVGISCQLGVELSEQSRALILENEALRREQLQARYDSLKEQLSPHFLFNSLSTLSGLVYDEPAAAEQFIEEMAKVYRYLLQHGEQATVSLRDELGFVRSYTYLLQMRFGDGISIKMDLPPHVCDRLIPPLALQLLVENVVKHNVVDYLQPLVIHIEFVAPDILLVRNAYCPRLSSGGSNGVGLNNLANRIRLLTQQELLVEQTPTEFRVLVPLPA